MTFLTNGLRKICPLFVCFSLNAGMVREKAFSDIYDLGNWDENGFSLSGSQIELSREYVAFLQDFMLRNHIHSVVDVGCGDWAFSRYIDWSGIQYTGIDIVKFVIERNQGLYGRPSIAFVYADALDMELPEADLMICKDVFQHLPNSAIMQILKQTHKFKHCLITDFVDFMTLSSSNKDIEFGQCHSVDLTKPPFNVKGRKVLNFVTVAPKQTLHIQQQDSSAISPGH